MQQTKTLTMFALASRTASANGTGLNTLYNLLPITQDAEGYTRHMMVSLLVGTVTGTTPTLDATVEGSWDGGTTYFTLTPSSPWTQVVASTNKQVRRYEGPLPPLVRGVLTIGGTSPVFPTTMLATAGG